MILTYIQLIILILIAAFTLLFVVSVICDTVKDVARIRAGLPTEQRKTS